MQQLDVDQQVVGLVALLLLVGHLQRQLLTIKSGALNGVAPLWWTPCPLKRGRLSNHAETPHLPAGVREQMVQLVRAGWSPEAWPGSSSPPARRSATWRVQADRDEGIRREWSSRAEQKTLAAAAVATDPSPCHGRAGHCP